jgi:hypothetical protein
VNVIAVLALVVIGTLILNAGKLAIPDDPGVVTLKTFHVYVGCVFILNLLWRLVWAFVGGPFAHWRALLPGGPQFGGTPISAMFTGRKIHDGEPVDATAATVHVPDGSRTEVTSTTLARESVARGPLRER